MLPHLSFGGILVKDPNSSGLGWVLVIFSVVMASGALFAWAWIPDVQNGRQDGSLVLESKTLEELAEGRRKAEEEGQVIGMRKKIRQLLGHDIDGSRRRSTGV